MARPRPRALRHHAALCRHQHARAAGDGRRLWREHPDVFVQTHIAENTAEIAWVARAVPGAPRLSRRLRALRSHRPRAVLAHGVHFDESEFARCHESGTALAHCPTSNMFLGSGLFAMRAARDPRRPVAVGLGTDIGAGTSFSLLATMGEAYKVAQLIGRPIDAVEMFYLATLGGARAGAGPSDRDARAGTRRRLGGARSRATPLMAFRNDRSRSMTETLAILATLGDDRAVRATYVAGGMAHVGKDVAVAGTSC